MDEKQQEKEAQKILLPFVFIYIIKSYKANFSPPFFPLYRISSAFLWRGFLFRVLFIYHWLALFSYHFYPIWMQSFLPPFLSFTLCRFSFLLCSFPFFSQRCCSFMRLYKPEPRRNASITIVLILYKWEWQLCISFKNWKHNSTAYWQLPIIELIYTRIWYIFEKFIHIVLKKIFFLITRNICLKKISGKKIHIDFQIF